MLPSPPPAMPQARKLRHQHQKTGSNGYGIAIAYPAKHAVVPETDGHRLSEGRVYHAARELHALVFLPFASHVLQEESSRPFEAYVNNGGTAVALRGPNYSIVAADTRLSTGYSIHTRDCSRVSQLTSQCAIATSGMHADTVALHKNLK
jgi:hypothetical protein